MADLTLRYLLYGDDKTASKTIKGVGGAFESLGSKIGGELGELFDKVGAGIDKLGEKGQKMGPKLMVGGAAVAGLGVALTALGAREKQATDQLDRAIENAGGTVSDYAGKIEETVKQQENFGHSAVSTKNALQILVTTTGDTGKSIQEMGLVANIAAARHISLADAATLVAKVLAGNGSKVLKQFGVTLDQSITDKSAQAQKALDQLSQKVDGQAAASVNNLAGKFGIAKVKIEDFVGEVGTKFGPAIIGVGGIIEGFGIIMETEVVQKAVEASKGLFVVGDAAVTTGEKVGRATIALGAIGAALTVAAVIYERFSNANAKAKERVDSLTNSLEADNGAIGDNTKKLIANSVATKSTTQDAARFGLTVADVTQAASGNKDAIDRVMGATDKFKNSINDNGDAARRLRSEVNQWSGALDDAKSKQDLVTTATQDATVATDIHRYSLQKDYDTVQAGIQNLLNYNEALFKIQQTQLDGLVTDDQWRLSLINLTDAVKTNGKSLDQTTEKGLNNRLGLEQLAQQAQQSAQKQIDAQGGTKAAYDAAAPAYAARIQALEDAATKAGYNKTEVKKLLDTYALLPQAVAIPVSAPGLAGVNQQFGDVAHQIQNLQAKFPGVALDTIIQLNRANVKGGRASGGPITSGDWLVGERGPEILSVGGNGYVTPNSALGGGGTYVTNVYVQGMLSNTGDLIKAVDADAASHLARGGRLNGRGLVAAGR